MFSYTRDESLTGVREKRSVASALDAALGREYYGFVSGKCTSPQTISAPNKEWGGALWMTARDDMNGARFAWANWRTNGNVGETGTGAPLYVRAAVEYPIGTRTALTFGGALEGVCADLTEIESDPCPVDIPRNARYRIHYYMKNANGMLYVGGTDMPFANFSAGDTFQYGGAGSLTNKTLVGDYGVTDANGGFCCPPIYVVGKTRRPSVVIAGDSRARGIKDRFGDANRHRGQFERALGIHFGFTNLSQGSETALTFTGAAAARRRGIISKYCTHLFIQYGINDLGTNSAATKIQNLVAQIRADAAAAKNRELKIYYGTITPFTTSTDSWATTANQTVGASEAERVTVNDYLRRLPPIIDGIVDVADVVETYRNSGKWRPEMTVDGTGLFDGLHETFLHSLAIANSRDLNPYRFRRGRIAG